MNSEQLLNEIREANLGYLLLAQHMINADRPTAMFRLGVSEELADVLERLTPGQILKMATSNMLLCRMRFDDELVMSVVRDYSRDRLMAQSHAAVRMAGQPATGVA